MNKYYDEIREFIEIDPSCNHCKYNDIFDCKYEGEGCYQKNLLKEAIEKANKYDEIQKLKDEKINSLTPEEAFFKGVVMRGNVIDSLVEEYNQYLTEENTKLKEAFRDLFASHLDVIIEPERCYFTFKNNKDKSFTGYQFALWYKELLKELEND